jgi:hypothetical protein
VDEIMCHLQSTSKEAPVVGFDPLPVRMGMGGSPEGAWEPYRIPSINKEVCLRINAVTPFSSKGVQF